jgi:5'-3' exonuclease
MVIVDFNGIGIGSIMGQLSRGEDLGEELIRHVILNNLRSYRVKYPEDRFGKMIVACDDRSWRRDIFPQYKANRTESKKDDGRDWTEIFRILNLVTDELRENFPYPVIKVDSAEADDIIGALVNYKTQPMMAEKIVIISADRDFIQLHTKGEVIQFSPMQQKMVVPKTGTAAKYTFEHLMKGDSGDGVPNVLSPDNSFTDKIRQTPMRQKLIDTWWDARDNLKAIMPEEAFRNYIRNRELIDLDRTPQKIKDDSIKQLESYKYPKEGSVLNFLIEKRMNMLIECAGEF